MQLGEADIELGDDLFGFCRVAGERAELADVGAHVGERVFGREGFDAVAEMAEEGVGGCGGVGAGEDEVGLELDDLFGEAVIGGEFCGDGVEAERGVDRLLREIGDRGDA